MRPVSVGNHLTRQRTCHSQPVSINSSPCRNRESSDLVSNLPLRRQIQRQGQDWGREQARYATGTVLDSRRILHYDYHHPHLNLHRRSRYRLVGLNTIGVIYSTWTRRLSKSGSTVSASVRVRVRPRKNVLASGAHATFRSRSPVVSCFLPFPSL